MNTHRTADDLTGDVCICKLLLHSCSLKNVRHIPNISRIHYLSLRPTEKLSELGFVGCMGLVGWSFRDSTYGVLKSCACYPNHPMHPTNPRSDTAPPLQKSSELGLLGCMGLVGWSSQESSYGVIKA